MKYTVKKLAKLANISVRTLHYYDEIGLLHPSFTERNGYRYYEEKELLKLTQILYFRELEFSLEEIRKIMNSKTYNRDVAMRDQKKLLQLKRKRLDRLINTIDEFLNLRGGESMKNDDMFASFADDELKKNMEEAKNRWGETDAYKQSMERVKNWTKKDYDRIKKEGEAFGRKLAESMDLPAENADVQKLIRQHHEGIEYFYECPLDMYRNLGQMYVDDPRFTKYYDKFRPGLAVWLRDAINYYCDSKAEDK